MIASMCRSFLKIISSCFHFCSPQHETVYIIFNTICVYFFELRNSIFPIVEDKKSKNVSSERFV